MNAIKKYWPTALHIIGVAAIFLSPAVKAYLSSHPQYAVAGVAWAEIMRWFQTNKGA